MSALSLKAVRMRGAEIQLVFGQAREHGRDPPRLEAAVDHQPAEEEPDEERRAQIDAALVRGGRAREAEEEEKAAEKQRRIVRVDDRPGDEQHVHGRHPPGHREELGPRDAVGVLFGPLGLS